MRDDDERLRSRARNEEPLPDSTNLVAGCPLSRRAGKWESVLRAAFRRPRCLALPLGSAWGRVAKCGGIECVTNSSTLENRQVEAQPGLRLVGVDANRAARDGRRSQQWTCREDTEHSTFLSHARVGEMALCHRAQGHEHHQNGGSRQYEIEKGELPVGPFCAPQPHPILPCDVAT